MKIIDKIKSFFLSANRIGSVPLQIIQGFNFLRRRSVEIDPTGNFAGWAFFAIDKIAERVASIGLELYELQRGSVAEIDDHPVLSLLYKPNRLQTKNDFFYLLAIYLKIWGASPVGIEYGKNKKPTALWPLQPQLLTMLFDQSGNLTGYEYRVNGAFTKLTTEEVIYIKKANPAEPMQGFSPMQAAAMEIDADSAAAMWNKFIIDNSAEPSFVLTTEQSLSDETYKRLSESWSARYAGPANAGKAAILEAGLKPEKISQTQKELDFIESRKFNKDTILTLLGMPPGLWDKSSTEANATVAERVFNRDTIEPTMRLIVDQLDTFLVPKFADSLWLGFASPVVDDGQLRLNEATAGNNNWMTINETRASYNLPPIEGGDVLYVALGTPLGQKSLSVELKLRHGKIPEAKEKQIKQEIYARNRKYYEAVSVVTEKVLEKISEKTPVKAKLKIRIKSAGDDFEEEGKVIWEKMVSKASKVENQLKLGLIDIINGQRTDTIALLKAEKGVKGVNDYIPDNNVVSAIFDLSWPLLQGLTAEQAAEALNAIGSNTTFDFSEAFGNSLKKNINRFAGDFNKLIKDSIYESLLEGLDLGESIDTLVGRVNSVFDGFIEVNAECIARTETIRASNYATNEAWKQSGVVDNKIWYTANDERLCEECASMHGKKIPLDDNFYEKGDTVGNMTLDYGDVGEPPLHPNCRCTIIADMV